MDISSYTSISQPSYGSGTKIASTAEDVSSANALKEQRMRIRKKRFKTIPHNHSLKSVLRLMQMS